MSEETLKPQQRALEERSRELFKQSVDGLDMRVRSRLTQARHAALEAAEGARAKSWFLRMPVLTSAAGVTAAAVLGVALWFGGPAAHLHGAGGADAAASPFEDFDLVASSDGSSDNNVEMLQDDPDFYTWAVKAAGEDPSA
jgi:negative regulator of sigma E activity